MCEVIDNGKTRVVNKGVDVAVIASSNTVAEAMKASRTLVVKGISTAVIEVMTVSPLDEGTFLSFAKKTKAMIFTEQYIYESAAELLHKQQPLIIEIIKEPTVQNIIQTTSEVIKRKLSKQ
jgi:transketolase C-terminal domain/subunit